MAPRQATNNDILRVLGRLEEAMEESKRQRTEMQFEVREVASRVAILNAASESLVGQDGSGGWKAEVERRLEAIEQEQHVYMGWRQRGAGFLTAVGIGLAFAGVGAYQTIHDIIARLTGLLKGP